MTPETAKKARALTDRIETLERLKEGFLDGSAFAPGVRLTIGSQFGRMATACKELVDVEIRAVESELEGL